jgi:hypothetical protein
MSGNVQEWCYDSLFDFFRRLRGGSWNNNAAAAAVANQDNYSTPDFGNNRLGFRIA